MSAHDKMQTVQEGCGCDVAHAAHESCCGESAHEEHGGAHACSCGHEHANSIKQYPVRLIVGIAAFGAAVLLSNLLALPWWASLILYGAAYLILGIGVLTAAAKNIARGKVFDENFLMMVATVGAFILGDYAEGTAVMLFYMIGEALSDYAVERSRRSITELMDIRPDTANLEKDGTLAVVAPQDVHTGDIIVIKPYEKVPLDSVVLSGASTVDSSKLTGESAPRDIGEGSEILSGFVNGAGLIRARVQKEYAQSTASKILEIVESAAEKKSKPEKFITKFARYYTPIVCAAALAVAVIPSIITGDPATWVYRALLFLVISCPCALVVAVPLSYFAGIGGESKRGVLVKGAGYMDALTQIRRVVFDKTGTITKGVFQVTDVHPAAGFTEDELMQAAAAAEANSSHPIAKSILEYAGEPDQRDIESSEEIAGYGAAAMYKGRRVLAGGAKLMAREGIDYTPEQGGGAAVYVAVDGKFAGGIRIADTVKPGAKEAISQLKSMGLVTAMLTGDNDVTAKEVASEVGVDEYRSELLPQDKVSILEGMMENGGGAAFVGDGVNDAPVLARADVGFAMGALGSDAAVEAADVVLMTDELVKIPASISLARRTRRIVWQNIIFALAVKTVVMVMGIIGLADMWWAVFADVGVTLLAVLNALRASKA